MIHGKCTVLKFNKSDIFDSMITKTIPYSMTIKDDANHPDFPQAFNLEAAEVKIISHIRNDRLLGTILDIEAKLLPNFPTYNHNFIITTEFIIEGEFNTDENKDLQLLSELYHVAYYNVLKYFVGAKATQKWNQVRFPLPTVASLLFDIQNGKIPLPVLQ